MQSRKQESDLNLISFLSDCLNRYYNFFGTTPSIPLKVLLIE